MWCADQELRIDLDKGSKMIRNDNCFYLFSQIILTFFILFYLNVFFYIVWYNFLLLLKFCLSLYLNYSVYDFNFCGYVLHYYMFKKTYRVQFFLIRMTNIYTTLFSHNRQDISDPHCPLNFRGTIAYWVMELNAAFCLVTRPKKWQY